MNRKTAIITGASSGFGKEIAYRLASLEYNLILIARRYDKLIDLKAEIDNKNHGIQVKALSLDVRDKNQIIERLNPIVKETIIDVLINNAGLALGLSSFENENTDDWDAMIDTNVKGLLYITKSVLPSMIENNNGYIINISSIAGKEVYPKGNVYCASKHAVDAISKALRIDTASNGIRVTNVNPGAAETEFSIVRFKGDVNKANQVYKGFQALSPIDIADTIQWLLSRPAHVNINEITIMPTSQPTGSIIYKKQH